MQDVHAAAVRFDLHIPQSRSLKVKRAAIRPIVDGLRHRFHVSVAEVDHHDQWQRAAIAVAVVAGSESQVRDISPRSSGSSSPPPTSSCSTSRPRGSRANGRERVTSARKYPRTARVNEVMLEVLADELERMNDPRLELVTFTGVDVSRDLAHAKVYYSTLTATAADSRATVPEDAAAALQAGGSHLRGAVGRQMRIRQVPKLDVRRSTPESFPVSASKTCCARSTTERRRAARVVPQATRRTRERRSSGRRRIDPRRPRRSAPCPRSAWRVTSVPTATRWARCSRCTTCSSRPAYRASRRSRSRSSWRRTTASSPGSSCSRRPTVSRASRA